MIKLSKKKEVFYGQVYDVRKYDSPFLDGLQEFFALLKTKNGEEILRCSMRDVPDSRHISNNDYVKVVGRRELLWDGDIYIESIEEVNPLESSTKFLNRKRDSILAGYHTEELMTNKKRKKKKCTYIYDGPLSARFFFVSDQLWDAIDDYDMNNSRNSYYDDEDEDYEDEDSYYDENGDSIADSLKYDYDLDGPNEYTIDDNSDVWYDMNNALEDVNEIVEYLPDNLKRLVVSIDFKDADSDNYQLVIKTNYELTDKELEQLKDYIDGQMSDGYGEGFEQIDFKGTEYVDDLGEIPIYVNISLWSPDVESILYKD